MLKILIDKFNIEPSPIINKTMATAMESVFAKLIRVSTCIIYAVIKCMRAPE